MKKYEFVQIKLKAVMFEHRQIIEGRIKVTGMSDLYRLNKAPAAK